ncbi:sulfotransferase domain-containing protein [Aequorivita antarctica]|uniref:Sulfotransferase n=1 Tax=Aequorivita antarctica TaxID=153266 RepID=A0A5C6YY10_9FLAO|nr:sulfotransferase domain-containing protein [Aequorivita antarctica]TXD72505.1 sulfotransferase [Aequorivita antarctica]SRX75401.1 hypothetical protein AEQU3_02395 [Aequorivita antarctica]
MFWKKEKLILQYASRRGGSTILAQILEAEDGVASIDQPFDLWKPESDRGKIIAEYIPAKAMSQFFELNDLEKKQVERYLKLIRNGRLQKLSNKPRCKKQILKIVNAQGLVDILSELVPSISVVMLRHPCSQALSVVKNKWGTCERPFLEAEDWSSKYLSKDQLEFGNKISQEGSYLGRAILNWCLEWHYSLKYSKQNYLILYYEDMILNPEKFIDTLFSYLKFKNKDKALSVLSTPSRSSSFSKERTLNDIKLGNKYNLLSNWREGYTIEDLSIAQEILDVFEIKRYSVNSNIPFV